MNLSSQHPFTVLLVDDRPENLVSLEEMLSDKGRLFLKATSGNEALKIVLRNDNIGLILLDVQMPGMDGFEVARILKSNTKTRDIAIIFVTAINKSEANVLQGFGEGAVDYLNKPLDINLTRAKVKVFEKLYFSQQQLKLANNQLEHINKQLERFVYMVSHDLKSPLASIIAMLSIIRRNPAVTGNASLQENLDMVYLSGNHLSEMIEAILQYSKKSFDQQALEDVDTGLLVSELVLLLMPPAHVHIAVSPNMPELYTRRQKLQQVFQNLLSNAIKYMNKPQGLVEVDALDNGNHVVFSVKDNGPGIARKDKERIFNLFQVGDEVSIADSKTGVGLNILKMLVEEQGGKIWVDSEPQQGSTFYFEWFK